MSEPNKQSDFLFYTTPSGAVNVQIIVGDETVWTTQKGMGDIFGTTKQNVSAHLRNIFGSGELSENAVVKEILTTAEDGKNYLTNFYNLDAIISVGYRVNSYQATQFRRWATKVLKEYLIKGFALDDARLKQGGQMFGKDYFDELLERIREIRASERRFYQKITDLYAACSIDYDSKSPITRDFYAFVQNKLHFAILGQTSAEIIKARANSKKPHMGLTNWKNAPQGKVLKSDVSIAKNYLNEEEIGELNLIVNMYLDYAELQAKKGVVMKMVDWISKLDAWLRFNEYRILTDKGKVSKKLAQTFAEREYAKFRPRQDKEFESDFDKAVKEIRETGRVPHSDIELDDPQEEFSDFNKNLKQALNHNPREETESEE